jgi:hypothetical protein
MPSIPRTTRVRAALIAITATILLAAPVAVLASHQFADVPDSHPFHNDIDAIADAGVTGGCGGGNYCPSSNVTRGQMAAFLNRLGALGPGKTPVANAATSLSTDGFSIGCPSGTVWSGGVCIETTPRSSTTYFDANDACAALSGLFGSGWRYRLPLVGELRGARGISGINLDGSGEWADAIHSEDDSYFSITVTDAGVINQESTISSNVYRCAALPLSVDFNLIIIPLDERDRYPEAPTYTPGNLDEQGSPSN